MGGRSERLVISLAGIWAELMVCSIATPIWWLTAPDTPIHEGAYFMMMLTGIVSLVVNWNPLIKLDGYYMLCEIIGIAELKEDSTAYLSAWVKRHIWKLPVEVPYVAKRRRPFYAIYGLLSGAYSYLVLTVVARFAGNVSRNFSPEWAFIPQYGVALLVFKSRIRLLVNFMKLVYLDKKDRVRAWLVSRPLLATAAILGFCLLPLWHQSTTGRFVLEPARRSVVRAAVPGMLSDIFVQEGSVVKAGEVLAWLRNFPLQSDAAQAQARLLMASSRAISAHLGNGDYGSAVQERDRITVESAQLKLKTEDLTLRSPIYGVVLTPRLRDRLGSYLTAGAEFVEVADLQSLRARIYVSEFDMYKVQEGAPAKVHVDGAFKKWDSRAASVTPVALASDPALLDQTKFKGLRPPQFYVVEIPMPDENGFLRPGMTGTARVYGRRRSLMGFVFEAAQAALGRKIW
jgi:putative peptide zinc metalloprotease protein